MNSPSLWFAALNIDLPKQNRSFGRGSALVFSDVLLILGLGLALLVVLAGAIYLWSKFGRKRRRHVSAGDKVYRGSNRHSDDPDAGSDDEVYAGDDPEPEHEEDHQGDSQSRRRYKYRVRRRTHRSRNPTLSETGGLPPVKAQEPGKPA
jgi:hypothetical protein